MQASSTQEAATDPMERLFYERALAGPMLGPLFRDAIHVWERHIAESFRAGLFPLTTPEGRPSRVP
jgi:hypothetical protein